MEPGRDPKRTWAAWLVRLGGLWVLAGALFKLFFGTPAGLPGPVRALPLDLGLTYNLVITAELCVAVLALLQPGWGWLPLALLLVAFDVVLVQQVLADVESCGCFGSLLTVPPEVMLAVDTALLALLLLARPWRALRTATPPLALVALLLAAAVALPWLLERQASEADPDGGAAPGRRWVELDVESWVGKDVWETPLGAPPLSDHLDVASLPPDGLWVFWRWTCDHCAEHLAALARGTGDAPFVTLVRLEEPHDTEANRVVHEMPSGGHVVRAALPDVYDYVITTPAEILLEGGRVVAAEEGVSPEDHLSH